VAVDGQGRLLVGNDGRRNIEVYDPTNGDLLAEFGDGTVQMPNAITLDAAGNIYVTDSRRGVVWVFAPSYELTGWIGNPGEGQEDLKFPIDAEVHSATQEIFIADQGNNRVQVYDLQGKWIRGFAFAGEGCSWFTGVCTVPGFMRLQALEIDGVGRLHVLDRFNGAVIVFDAMTDDQIGVYGSFGTEPGQLKLPTDVLSTQPSSAIVTAGDGDRIETFSVQ
jgi:tripartite motif-containing protein 71